MKILVTGANGLLGHHVVMQLLERGEEVKIIVRSLKNIYFNLDNIEVIEGNFTSVRQLQVAAAGCDAIIHIAAVTATDLLRYDDYSTVNVFGSENIINTAKKIGIKKIVFISTANTIGYGTKENNSNEESPIEFPFSQSYYARSKVEAEKRFIDFSTGDGMHVIIINPAFMIGSFDTKPSSGKLMLMGYRKKWMFAPRGGKSFVAVTDVATAVCNALTMGVNGKRYLAAGENLSFGEFYKMQSRVGEYHQKIIELPDFLLEMVGKVGDLLRLLGIRTEVCSMNLNQLMIREYYESQRCIKELKMPQKKLETAILEALEWFCRNGKIS